jgi:LysR family nitrogen assimilation transcriptional regulator
LDLALLFDPPPSPQLSYELLLQETLILVAPAHSAKLPKQIKVADLVKYQMVLPAAPNAIRSLIDALLRPLRIELELVAEVGAVQTVLSLVAQGIGCTILPKGALSVGAGELPIQYADIGPPAVTTEVVLAIPRAGSTSRLLRETVDLLKSMELN